MDSLVIIAAGFCFLLHLICETLASFLKYNFAGLGRHMHGISMSNIVAVCSRGFVSIYGLIVAYIIERNLSDGFFYGMVLSSALLIGASISFWFSCVSMDGFAVESSIKNWVGIVRSFEYKRAARLGAVSIGWFWSLLLGVQFVSVAIAYGFCFIYPQHRLFIVSLVPLVSMVGTLSTVVIVEPKLAKTVDNHFKAGHEVSSLFMRARSGSFALSALLMLLVTSLL